MQRILLFLFFIIVPCLLMAQVLPKEGSVLNYRIVGFSFPEQHKADNYKIEIAAGYYNSEDSFVKKTILSAAVTTTRIVKDVPFWGCQYTWRVVYDDGKKGVKKSAFYHFSTGKSTKVDSGAFRLRVMQPAAESYRDYYVSVNSNGALYDMSGRPVWFIPDTNGMKNGAIDLKFTKDSTITFIQGLPYEINLNGDILWKGPKYDKTLKDTGSIRYHHEFIKLSNGHYMAMGMETLMCKTITSGDSKRIEVSDSRESGNGFTRGRFSIIYEYDAAGNVVWSWAFSKHLLGTDYDYFHPIDSNIKFDPHENAFAFDEDNKVLYLNFRNLNRVIKIDYPSGKVIRSYGENFKTGVWQTGAGLFCNQHSLHVSKNGYLYYYNNNSCGMTDSLPTVVIIKEPVNEKGTLEKVWEYTCTEEAGYKKRFESGGSVMELPDGSFFVCMGSDYSKIFIVNRDKKELWSAIGEIYYTHENKWRAPRQERATIISRADLEKLVWKAENAKRTGIAAN